MDNQMKSLFKQIKDESITPEDAVKQLKLLRNRIISNKNDDVISMEAADKKIPRKIREKTDEMNSFRDRAIDYFKKLLSSTLKLPVQKIEPDAPFEKYGIDSIMVMQLTNKLEQEFGSLSKTLFFEYQDISSLTGYFLKNHQGRLVDILGMDDEPAVLSGDSAISTPVIGTAKDPARKRKRIRFLDSGRLEKEPQKDTKIAIIGLSGQYPGAKNIEEFWDNLRNGRDSITGIPENRWDWKTIFDQVKKSTGKSFSKWGGFLEGVDEFDPLFFNISPLEAEIMDPQERMFLVCSYNTLEDAGYTRYSPGNKHGKKLGVKVGVYAGIMYEEYQFYGIQEQARGRMIASGGSPSSIANRVSYAFNFQGPSIAVDTMCSSSLTSVHLACKGIQNGECDAAIAGGVNVSIHPNKYLILAQGNFTSSKGRCESFGKGGDGYVPSEGVGAVLLKPLSKAIADGDHIYGVIRGCMLNAGGKTNGYTVPNPIAQGEVIQEAIVRSGVNARSISYIEAHGTGTSLGDPIEIAGLIRAFRSFTPDRQFCAIGSVKSNIGHCESAAGIAALTKVLLQLKHRELVPSIHSETLNPNINFEETPFFVQQKLAGWKSDSTRIAGISAFGAGGANAHIVIEEYPDHTKTENAADEKPGKPWIIVLSAKKPDRLKQRARDLLKAIDREGFSDQQLPGIAYTLQIGREGMEERLAFTVDSMKELKEKLTAFIDGDVENAGLCCGQVKRDTESISLFTVDKEMAEAIDKWIQRKKYIKLLDLWVKGLDFDWNRLYGENKPEIISLPVYPFNGEKYWITGIRRGIGQKPVITGRSEKREKAILVKEWEQKNITIQNSDSRGVIIILGTLSISSLMLNLFKENEGVSIFPVIHGTKSKKGMINTDFYSTKAGEELYHRAKEHLGESGFLGVIDITALDSDYEDSTAIESGKIRFFQKLIENDRNKGFKLLQVSYRINNFKQKETTMQGARLAGLYRMLGAEYRNIESVTMDCDSQIKDYQTLVQQIQNEFLYKNEEKLPECCYRDKVRYEPCMAFATAYAKNNDQIKNISPTLTFDENDVILIAGGSRGIGAAIAEHIVSRGVKHLVIMGREELPGTGEWEKILKNTGKPGIKEKIRRMQGYREKGVTVHYYSVPLTDERALSGMVDEIHRHSGPVTGVFFCAGMMSRNPAFYKKEIPDIEKVGEAKISGMTTLHRVLEKEPLSFSILFSSVSGIFPALSPGQGDYAFANSYMDYYAMHQAGNGKGYITSLQWPVWGETGLAQGTMVEQAPAYSNSGLLSLTTEEGLGFLDMIRSIPGPVCVPCVISPGEFRIKNLLKIGIISPVNAPVLKDIQPVEKMKSTAAAGQDGDSGFKTAVKHWLKELMKTELKLTESQIDEEKPFDEYGVDSIVIAQIVQSLQKNLSTPVSPSLFLEKRTLRDLTDYFLQNHVQDLQKILDMKADITITGTYPQNNSYPEEMMEPWYVNRITRAEEEDIAVVGMSCRFSDAPVKDAFWELLVKGLSAIKPVPAVRWQTKGNRIDYGGWIDDIDLFDPDFFNLKSNDAAIMDPQARIILEESLNAICDAGYNFRDLSGRKIGVFVGGRLQPGGDMKAILKASNPILGIGQNYLATNISRFFNFTGPSMVVDTACSSGLTAMAMAQDMIKARRIDMAMIGVVNLISGPFTHNMFAARNILSKTGEFHIFDKRSGGEVLGEGSGAVIIKRLRDAITDGNKIYGIIKAIAVNNDGKTLGPGSPNIQMMKQVIQEALMFSGKKPEDIGYIEVNGGGSPVVDSIEIKVLSELYKLNDLTLPRCAIGSIKPNIGHSLLTAGLAGFIRCVLSVYHKKIPPFLSGKEPVTYYDFNASRVLFNREPVDWKVESGKTRIAAQNSFPDGGTNCHVIIEEFENKEAYKQNYFSIPVPEMNKKRFPISWTPAQNTYGLSDPVNDIEIGDLKKMFKLEKDEKIQNESSSVHNVWGKTV